MNCGNITASEKRVAKRLGALLPKPNKSKKRTKPLEGLFGCKNIWKEPKQMYIPKKVEKMKKMKKTKMMKKMKKMVMVPEGKRKCGVCGEKGHNLRTCPLKCSPCADQIGRSYCFAGLTQREAVHMAKVMGCESVYGETEEYY